MDEFEQLLESILPPSATILKLQNSNNRPAILLADIDGDRLKELIVAYEYLGENYLLLLKKSYNLWYPMIEIKGKGYAITDLMAVPLTARGVNSLVVGWQIGDIWSQLVLLQWKIYGFINLLTKYVVYSKLFVEDMPGKYGKDGQFELAIWLHDTGEAYKVEVYRYNGTNLTVARDVYPYYFKKVAVYYKQLLQQNSFPYYWYYLAEALLKTGEINHALTSIDMALTFTNPYPSKEKMLELKHEILSKLRPT
ncbi:hypothetical protein [Rummeliibacillus pycnus]|uniref:hypothetical protein n=1 Tax=Rummeliibacillus pycnus TaxID=101070 RepID=UPI000C9A50A6|nr:hypothetical protein [Rummeliibacillus pycnus]